MALFKSVEGGLDRLLRWVGTIALVSGLITWWRIKVDRYPMVTVSGKILFFLLVAGALTMLACGLVYLHGRLKERRETAMEGGEAALVLQTQWILGHVDRQGEKIEAMEGERRALERQKHFLEARVGGLDSALQKAFDGWNRSIDMAERNTLLWGETEERFAAAYRTVANMDILLGADSDPHTLMERVDLARRLAGRFGRTIARYEATVVEDQPESLKMTPEVAEMIRSIPAIVTEAKFLLTPSTADIAKPDPPAGES